MANPMNVKRRLHWLMSIGTVTYIALIGIFAIEEIKARDDTLALLSGQQREVASDLAFALPASTRHQDLERRRDTLAALRARLEVLIIDGAVPIRNGRPGTLKEILCELALTDDPHVNCPVENETAWTASTVIPHLLLKYLSEESATGAVLAVLIITAAFGGALIRMSLESPEPDGKRILLRTLLRAIGGGIVCYLIVVGGNLPIAGAGLQNASGPATASLLGLLAGMFSNKVFELLSELVDAFVDKVRPKRTSPTPPPVTETPAIARDRACP
jgi:uncharacterized protein YidB (DUF937 family)